MAVRTKSTLVKGAYSMNYRYIGYFPTVNLMKILPLFENNDAANMCRICSFRSGLMRKRKRRPLPYVEVTDLADTRIDIDYNSIRHGSLDVKALENVIVGAGANNAVLRELCIMLPRATIYEEKEKKKGRPIVAIFESHHARAPNGDYKRALDRHIDRNELRGGFKRSSTDLGALQDSTFWVRGSRKGYYKGYREGVMEDAQVIRRILNAIDPDRALRRLREYRRGKIGGWVLVKDRAI